MPTRNWHIAKKDHDLDTRVYLGLGAKYPDWEVVAFFYSAVHFVDAYLATLGKHPRSHSRTRDRIGRNDMVRMYLATVEAEYMRLYHLSRAARYGPQTIQKTDVEDAEDWFNAVKSAVGPVTTQ